MANLPGPRLHIRIVEVEHFSGDREWVSPTIADKMVATGDYFFSDADHSANCWCFER